MKVLVINPGATSTKIAVFNETVEEVRISIDHSAQELAHFEKVADQMPYRKELICKALEEKGVSLSDMNAICGRGGLLKHIPSGTYQVNEAVIADILNPPYGEHASNLGAYITGACRSSGHPCLLCRPRLC